VQSWSGGVVVQYYYQSQFHVCKSQLVTFCIDGPFKLRRWLCRFKIGRSRFDVKGSEQSSVARLPRRESHGTRWRRAFRRWTSLLVQNHGSSLLSSVVGSVLFSTSKYQNSFWRKFGWTSYPSSYICIRISLTLGTCHCFSLEQLCLIGNIENEQEITPCTTTSI
jgi:hypothetical protein